MSLQQQLTRIFGDAFDAEGVDRSFGEVVVSQRPELADFQCNGALGAARTVGRNPREIAEGVASRIESPDLVASVDVAGPGFLNICVTDDHLAGVVASMEASDRLDVVALDDPRTVVVDYGGPNMSKALHVGHLRAAVIGESLKRIFRFLGYDTIGDIHIGDWGMPVGQLIVELRDRQPNLIYFDPEYDGPYPSESPVTLDDLSGMYPVITQRCADDPETAERARQATFDLQNGRAGYLAVWKHFHDVSISEQRKDFGALGVEFDVWYGESTVHDRLEPMVRSLLSSGIARTSEGAVIVDVGQPEDKKEMPPLLLTRSDGSYLYSTTDLATIDMRVADMDVDAALYVVDARQSLHFEQVFRAARRAGYASDETVLEHIGFGTVNDKHGKPFKTREGGVLRLGDLISLVTDAARERLDEAHIAENYPTQEREAIARQVGLAALKFGDLSNHRTSNYIFDLDRFSAFEGKTGPYLQYSAVRIKSILRKAEEAGLVSGRIVAPTVVPGASVDAPPRTDSRGGEPIRESPRSKRGRRVRLRGGDRFQPLLRALPHLARRRRCRQASWLSLVEVTLRALTILLDLLGIEIPERM